jgi:hypothetical protein
MSRSLGFRSGASAVILCLTILAIVLAPHPARSRQEITSVEVVNTPLPVKALDPLPVAIAGVPSVDLDGTPSVEIAPPEPFQTSRRGVFLGGGTETSERFTVPEGNLLVIEYFTAFTEVTRGQRVHFSLSVQTNGSYATHQLVCDTPDGLDRSGSVRRGVSHVGRLCVERAHEVLTPILDLRSSSLRPSRTR